MLQKNTVNASVFSAHISHDIALQVCIAVIRLKI
jgi:hypothetical protein